MTNPNTSRFLDFDALWEEQEHTPVIVRIFGKDEELPAYLPASVVLNLMKHQRSGKLEKLDGAEAMELGISVFGRERVERWSSENGLDIMQLAALLKHVVKMYTDYTPHADAALGEAGTGAGAKKAASL
jgi:hypothetical protein